MADLIDAEGRIDRELFGPLVTVGGHLLQPVARMTGRAGGSGGGVQITPTRVKVIDPGGQEQTVPIFDLTRQSLAAIARVGLAVAAVCGLVIMLRNLVCGRNQVS